MIHALKHKSYSFDNPLHRASYRSVKISPAAPLNALSSQHRTPFPRSIPQISAHTQSHTTSYRQSDDDPAPEKVL